MRFDVGLAWAKLMAVVGQIGIIQGIANSLMIIGIFYTTTIRPEFGSGFPLWLYLAVVFVAIGSLVSFVLTVGISGYYRFFNQQSALDRLERKVDKIMKHQGILND